MEKVNNLYKEYESLKEQAIKNKSINLKEEFKNKLIELDYELNRQYEEELKNKFPMTTTLDKEEKRLEELISFVEEKSKEQKNLINDYKKLTGDVIELSYLKYTDNLKDYVDRLRLVREFLRIKDEAKTLLETSNKRNSKFNIIKNKLMRKDLLSLLYEFCLIDSLEITSDDIDLDRIIKDENSQELPKKQDDVIEKKKEAKLIKELSKINIKEKPLEVPKQEVKKEIKPEKEVKLEIKKEIKPEVKPEVKKEVKLEVKELPKEEVKPEVKELPKEEIKEEKILTKMPKIDKLGTVTPVNVFESLKKTEEALPNVVIPSNGLQNENSEIFLNTEEYFK